MDRTHALRPSLQDRLRHGGRAVRLRYYSGLAPRFFGPQYILRSVLEQGLVGDVSGAGLFGALGGIGHHNLVDGMWLGRDGDDRVFVRNPAYGFGSA